VQRRERCRGRAAGPPNANIPVAATDPHRYRRGTLRVCIASALVVVTATASIACAQESDAARVALDRAVAFAGSFDRVYGMTTLVVSSVVRRETGAGPSTYRRARRTRFR
jgi:hypothetical protein